MFIKTENNGFINISHYPRIGVYSQYNTEPYYLCAFTKQTAGDEIHNKISIAKFDEEADVNYALCSLFKAIDAGESIWDPNDIKLPSVLWNEIIEESTYDGFIGKEIPIISGLHKVQITYSDGYDLVARHDSKKTIDGKLIEALTALDPIKIEWKSARDAQ